MANQSAVPTDDTVLIDLVELLQSINVDSSLAVLNMTTITDNNGGRILL